MPMKRENQISHKLRTNPLSLSSFVQNCFKTSLKAKLRLFPLTNKTCLNQDVAGCKTFLQKGVIELLSKTCNSVICLREA